MTLITGYNANLRAAVVKRWRELEEEKLHPTLPQTYKEAVRALLVELEQKELIAAERDALKDEAIRTKAHISDKKTATAMATAAVACKRVKKLETQLGLSTDYMQA